MACILISFKHLNDISLELGALLTTGSNEAQTGREKAMKMLKNIDNIELEKMKNVALWCIAFLFFYCLFTSCKHSNSYYIISQEGSINRIEHTNADGVVLIPPKVKYAPYTFVIDSNNNIYFYSFPEEKKEPGIFDEEDPNSIGLMPNHVFIIPKGTERGFFEENVLFLKSSRSTKNVMIASFRDTINNDFLSYVRNLSQDKTTKIQLKVRLALQEERRVIRCKLNGEYYQSIKSE